MIRGILLLLTLSGQLFAAPNPAYLFCIRNGGVIETREDSMGNQDGVCMFNIAGVKSECGQWAYFWSQRPGDGQRTCLPGQCALWSVETNTCVEPIPQR